MEIQKKITYQFTIIVAVLMLLSFVVVYFLFSSERKEGFYFRLADKVNQVFKDKDYTLENVKENYWSITPKLPNEIFQIYDSENELVYSNINHYNFQLDSAQQTLLYNKKEITLKDKGYEIYGIEKNIGAKKINVFIAAKDIYGFKKLKKLRIILMLVFLINLLIIFFIGHIFAVKALKPISNIINQVNNITIDNINSRIQTTGNDNDEISQLAKTFNKLLERIEDFLIVQKDFITNSSHELRTPLTAITGQLEVTLFQERSVEEYKTALNSILDDIKNLNQLANRLLLLSRANNDLTFNNYTQIRIDDVLWEVRADELKKHKSYDICLHFDDSIKEEQHFLILGNKQLLKIAFMNLVDNGCKYSDKHKIDIDLSVQNNQLIIMFKDNGIGIPEDEINYIFEPFYRAKNVRKNKGHGIGLSIVKKIIKLHKAEIKVNSILKKGTTFKLFFDLDCNK